MPIRPLESQRLYQQAADQIRKLIRAGEYRPGERLPAERELAKRLGVSRPTVREAMIALEIAGIVDIRAGAGLFVSDAPPRGGPAHPSALDAGPSPFDLLDARRIVECESVERAARRATRADLAAIKAAIVAMERDMAKGGDGRVADRRFHARIAATTRNGVLASLIGGLWDDMSAPLFDGLSRRTGLPDHQHMTLADHKAIYACLRRHDAPGARAAMDAHLTHVEAILADARDLAAATRRRRKGKKRAGTK